jgi:hypothetical protein
LKPIALAALGLLACSTELQHSVDGGANGDDSVLPDGGTNSNASDGGGGAGGSAASSCEVLTIVQTKCGACHGKALTYGAPMSLTTFAELVAPAPVAKDKLVYQQIGVRTHDALKPMPPKNYPPLTSDELSKLDAWIAAGAPAAQGACAPVVSAPTQDAGMAGSDWPTDCEQTYKFLANDNGQPHSVPANHEGYVDFMFPVPWKESVQAVAFRPIIDNDKVLHHWILYQGANAFLNGWAPGKPERILPTNIGVFMPASGTLKMTFHYYNKSAISTIERDSSGVEVCVTRKFRANTAFTYPFTASASAPAGRTVSNENSCTVQATEDIHLVTSGPHMHRLGIAAKFEILRANGLRETITNQPFDFEQQTDELIDVVVRNGDKVSVTCTYKNDTKANVSFGQNTDQEMCFNFALYYPMCAMKCTGGDALAAAISQTQGGGCPSGVR